MNLITRFNAWLERLRNPWPHAIPLPPHVAAVRLDPKLLMLHLDAARYPSAHVGYIKPSKE